MAAELSHLLIVLVDHVEHGLGQWEWLTFCEAAIHLDDVGAKQRVDEIAVGGSSAIVQELGYLDVQMIEVVERPRPDRHDLGLLAGGPRGTTIDEHLGATAG